MKILEYNPEDYSEEAVETRKDFQAYNRVKSSFREFEIKCDLEIFRKFFGKSEGERLWNHFTINCKRNLEQFFTYLTEKQKTSLYFNMYKNQELYY